MPPISWSPGEDATQHDVYFGTDELPVGAADVTDTTGIYRLRQNTTTYTPPEGAWQWYRAESNDDGAVVNWTLPAGTHTLEIAKHEDGVLLDAILITDNVN